MGWILLAIAIAFELTGTISMKLSASFTKLIPSIVMFVCYAASFTLINYALNYLQVSVVYAVWSGVGIVLISIASIFIFNEKLPVMSYLWIGLIVIGVIGLQTSSKGH
ncbi:DMT family transporter [Paenibacillus montanisoli]|uniref:QacE family quaternary ammonium compound efflux SMR transporter n=1 Tax=Paenibacillus montanisoli TaxID=2081970 RepID=A0A328TY69_9BACL|nr:multidrug efflux SMR transporter [Paenibacillus montanisoli]RAP74672.1 QacE family quaternary ammonium compound efflux SMR transporter [Paenibacillus montanisoli]